MKTILYYINIKKVFVMTKGTDFFISLMRPQTRRLLMPKEIIIMMISENNKIGYNNSVTCTRKHI